jgi:hypothetical protein
MKLTNLTTKMKSNAVRVLAAATLAGAFLAAAAPAAQAEQFGIGVRIGGPRYFVPPPPPPRFYGPVYGYYGWRAHEDWRFHHGYRRW